MGRLDSASVNSEATITMGARQLQYLLEQGRWGYHALFETSTIKRAMGVSPVLGVEDDEQMLEAVTAAAREISELGDVIAQRRYILQLSEEMQNVLVHLYFRFLDQFIQSHSSTIH